VIGGENSRKPVFGFWLLGEKEFCKGLCLNETEMTVNPITPTMTKRSSET